MGALCTRGISVSPLDVPTQPVSSSKQVSTTAATEATEAIIADIPTVPDEVLPLSVFVHIPEEAGQVSTTAATDATDATAATEATEATESTEAIVADTPTVPDEVLPLSVFVPMPSLPEEPTPTTNTPTTNTVEAYKEGAGMIEKNAS
jgi:hypothetical protein